MVRGIQAQLRQPCLPRIRRYKQGMDGLAFICVAVGALVLAYNQALLNAPAVSARHSWMAPGWLNYVPAIFVTFAILFYAIKFMASASSTEAAGGVAAMATDQAEPGAVLTAGRSTVAAANSKSDASTPLVIVGLPVKELAGYFSDKTTVEAKELVKPFKGLKVVVSGVVDNVSEPGYDKSVDVRLIGAKGDVQSAYVTFSNQDRLRVVNAKKGDKMTAECFFDGDVYSTHIMFEKCSLVN